MKLSTFDNGEIWGRIGEHGLSAVLLGPLCLFLPFLHCESQASPQSSKAQIGAQEPLRTAQASRVEKASRMDGTLDDPLWKQATPIVSFLQREPYEGETPTEQTEVRILYTKRDVYFEIVLVEKVGLG